MLLHFHLFEPICKFHRTKFQINFRATIEVDEKGTVASAVTMRFFGGGGPALPPQPVHITVDRPFLFLLHKNENILFAGRVVNPQ